MRSKKESVIAIFCADLHLSLNPPVWRSNEPDWFAAMKRPLDEIKKIQEANNRCPILCAGDIFDKWNSLPELINFAIDNLPPNMYSIPGQHDLPLHNYDDIKKSAYWTLNKSQSIVDYGEDHRLSHQVKTAYPFMSYQFPFGKPLTNLKECYQNPNKIQVAFIHEYCWIKGHNYTSAPKEDQLTRESKNFIDHKLKGYDVIVYGDNHKGFLTNRGETQVFNCGSLMRRHSDQIDYKPQVGLLLKSGKVIPHYLDIHEDKYLELKENDDFDTSFNMKEFIQELEKLGNTDLDFTEAMKRYLKKNKIKKLVQNIILSAMGV